MQTRVRPVKLEVKPESTIKKEISVKAEETPIKPEPALIKSEAALIKLEPSTAAASKIATASKKRARPATAEGPSAKRTLPQARPTEQECRAVHRALATLHPEVMERVRTERSGERGPGGGSCGRRACVLDSLVGTILSQNTTDTNSHRAFSRLKTALPSWEEVRLRTPYASPNPNPNPNLNPRPDPRPSPNPNPNPDPNQVRLAAPEVIEEAIRPGGLAAIKTARIQLILDTLHHERGECSLEHMRAMSDEQVGPRPHLTPRPRMRPTLTTL
jgi:endonuclease III